MTFFEWILKLCEKKVPIATDHKSMRKQMDEFLAKNNLPQDDLHRRMFAQMVQVLPPDEDYYNPSAMARAMRKARANEAAYFNLHPHKIPQEPIDDPGTTEEATKEVV